MTQNVYTKWWASLDPEKLNLQIGGAVQSGIKQGYRCTEGTVSGRITIQAGKLFTDRGDMIEEDADLTDYFGPHAGPGRLLTPNTSASARVDLIVCNYYYVRNPNKQATYSILLGTPGTDLPPAFSNVQFPIAYAVMNAGASTYSAFYPYPRVYRYNHYIETGVEKIRYGNNAAIKVAVFLDDVPFLDIDAGIHVYFVEADTLADGATITTWLEPFNLGANGEANIQAWIQEIIDARGNMTCLDDRLSVSLDDDGNYKNVGLLKTVRDEVVEARGTMHPSFSGLEWLLDDRLDRSLDEYGDLKLAQITGRITHQQLKDMGPDAVINPASTNEGGLLNSDHDARYYPRGAVDAKLSGVMGDGVLSGCGLVSKTYITSPFVGYEYEFAAGYVFYNGQVIEVDSKTVPVSLAVAGNVYVSVDSSGEIDHNTGGYGTGVPIAILTTDARYSDTRSMIKYPDRRNTNRFATNKLGSADQYGGGSIMWTGKLAIGEVIGSGDDYVDINMATSPADPNPFTAGMTVIFYRTLGAEIYFRTVDHISFQKVYFTAGGLPLGATGTLSQCLTIDRSINWRDRYITVSAALRERDADDNSIMPGGADDDRTFAGLAYLTTGTYTPFGSGNVNTGLVYAQNGVDFSEAGWTALNTLPGYSPSIALFSDKDSGSDEGWRLFADQEESGLILARAKSAWTGSIGAYVYFMLKIDYSPRCGAYN